MAWCSLMSCSQVSGCGGARELSEERRRGRGGEMTGLAFQVLVGGDGLTWPYLKLLIL